MKTLRAVLQSIAHSPGKSVLTIFTVGAGVGVLILALSVSSVFSSLMEKQLNRQGSIITFVNGELNALGEIETVRPPELDENVGTVLKQEIPNIVAISPVVTPRWREVKAGQTSYQIRSVLGVSDEYLSMMGLEPIAGTLFTSKDVNDGLKKAVITESLAIIMYGSVDNAIGSTLQPPAMPRPPRRGSNETEEVEAPTQIFTVVGVVKDSSEIQRKAYGVADAFIPYTTAFPFAMNNAFAKKMLNAMQIVKVKDTSVKTAEARIKEALYRAYGDDVSLYAWEGTPSGETAWLEQTRKTVNTFTLVVNLLGFLLLVISSIGILSIMLIEVLNRSKEIALERAFGATKFRILKEFFGRSVLLSLLSAVIGIALSLVFSKPLQTVLEPIFSGIGIRSTVGNTVTPLAVLIGTGSALVVGGLFGLFPVFSAMKAPISETIRSS